MNRVLPLVGASLLGALVAGAGTWITFAREVVPRAEVIELIHTNSPYVPDKRALEDATEQLDMLADGQQNIREELARIRVMVEDLRGRP